MTTLPDFITYGYQVIEQLNHNIQGGRITYKALELASRKPVVIKQFRFATTGDWESYKAIEREIDVLQGLNHPGIPRYLAQFDPSDGLCLVQEYKQAQPLSKLRSFSPEDIKSIATQILEVLVYLQQRIPPIFHRDIKPENILVDDNIKTYLVDFGLAKIGNSTVALSSMMGGTLGFMPPEQIHNQKLTEASDLYGLGATLICLITQTKSVNIGSLVNFSTNKIAFQDKVPKFKFSIRFIQWLEKIVEPNPANRYQNAQSALEALEILENNSILIKDNFQRERFIFIIFSVTSITVVLTNPIFYSFFYIGFGILLFLVIIYRKFTKSIHSIAKKEIINKILEKKKISKTLANRTQKEQKNSLKTRELYRKEKSRLELSKNKKIKQLDIKLDRELAKIERNKKELERHKKQELANELRILQQNFIRNQLNQLQIKPGLVAGIGEQLVQELGRARIVTAGDISYSRVIQIHGIGQVKASNLVYWRQTIETNAQNNSPKVLPQEKKESILKKFEVQSNQLNKTRIYVCQKIEEDKDKIRQNYRVQREDIDSKIQRTQQQLKQNRQQENRLVSMDQDILDLKEQLNPYQDWHFANYLLHFFSYR